MSEAMVDPVAREAQLAVWGFCREQPSLMFRHVARRVLGVPGLVTLDEVLAFVDELPDTGDEAIACHLIEVREAIRGRFE